MQVKGLTLVLVVVGAANACFGEVDWAGKKVSVAGDSYSEWKGYPNKSVSSESKMWWAQTIMEFGGILCSNTARGGCAYSYTYGTSPVIWYLNQNGALGNPNIILSMGGLNDFWVLETRSAYGCADSTFRIGLNKLFDLYDSDYAGAEVYQIIPKAHCTNDYLWGLSPRYRRAIRELARARGYHVIDLDGYFGTEVSDTDTPQYPHPTLQGMNKIAARVISEIRNGCGGYAQAYDYLETDGVGYMLTDVETNNLTRVEFKIRSTADKFESLRVSGGESLRVSEFEGLRGGLNVVESREVDGFCEQLVIGCASPSNDNSPLQLYSLKIYEGSALKHSYIPVKDKYGNATLYDECEDRCLVVRGGTFQVLNYEGGFVNYEKCMAYGSLVEAYADAAEGETVTVREALTEPEMVVGRIGVKIDTRGFSGITMVSESSFYDAVLEDGVWQMVPVDIQPKFLCERVEDLWTPGADGQVRIRLGNVRSNLYYSVYTATNCLGPWKCVGLGFEQSEFSYPAPELGESFFVKAMVEE